ncbi:MAG: hypothetical protein ABSG73_11740 [Candidatus Aminicenantales bacterium]|jgi:hypothetical protein
MSASGFGRQANGALPGRRDLHIKAVTATHPDRKHDEETVDAGQE